MAFSHSSSHCRTGSESHSVGDEDNIGIWLTLIVRIADCAALVLNNLRTANSPNYWSLLGQQLWWPRMPSCYYPLRQFVDCEPRMCADSILI